MATGPHYILRVVDRGTVHGVPVVDAYLIRRDGSGCESCLMTSAGLSLAPPSVETIVEGLGELGVRVVREVMPSVDEVKQAAYQRRKTKEQAKQPPMIGEGI